MPAENNREQNAVMYLRVASAHNADTGSILQQREGCQRIANSYGLTIIREYVDRGTPARLERQIMLQHLLTDLAKQRDVAYVVVWDYSRLSHSLADLTYIEERLRACDAKIATITGVTTVERFMRRHNNAPGKEPY